MKKNLKVLLGVVLSFTPTLAFAASACVQGTTYGTIPRIICTVGDLLNVVIPVLVALGVVYFIWGVISYVIGSDEEAKKKGRDRMIFGIIGLAVIIAMWGLVNLLLNTFGLGPQDSPSFPSL